MPKHKRAVKDVPIFADRIFSDLAEKFRAFKVWNYKTENKQLPVRDKALFAALILIGPRAEEMGFRKKQFYVKPNEVIAVNIETVKHGDLRKEVVLPRIGSLGFYTEVFLQWLQFVPEPEDFVFPQADTHGGFQWSKPLSRWRIWQIIKEATGLFPHWFRGVHETIYGRLVFQRDAWKLKEHMGLKRLDSTAPYVRGEMEEQDKQRLKTL